MKTIKWEEIEDRYISKERQAKNARYVAKEVKKLRLRAVRELVGMTQTEVAKRAGMAQPEISRLEDASNAMIDTTRRYIEGLGGELELVAVFGKKRVPLKVA